MKKEVSYQELFSVSKLILYYLENSEKGQDFDDFLKNTSLFVLHHFNSFSIFFPKMVEKILSDE